MSQKNIPDYGTPELVLKACDPMRLINEWRSGNRVLIDNLFNGKRPYSPEEVEKHQIHINVNFGEGAKILQDANRQVNSALLHKGNFFTATCLGGQVEKREEYSQKFTANINRILKKSKRYMFVMKNRNACLTLHGIGPLLWLNDYDWLPRFVALEDLLIPTNTTCDLVNLPYFGVHLYWTPYELMEATHGDKTQKGWNISAVRKILSAYKNISTDPDTYNWFDQPEKMAQVWKQNRAFYDTDSVPKVRLLAFFYKSPDATPDKKQEWYRKIVLREVPATDSSTQLEIKDEFIFESDKVFSQNIDHLLHVQFGDYNLVPPLTYHSVRGLGDILYAVIELLNRTRCQFAQHVLEQMMMYFRIHNPADRSRPNLFELFQYAVLQDGVEIVPKEQRHQIDSNLVEAALSEYRQLLSESSSSYVQDIDSGSQKEMTLGEAQIRLQSVNKMVSGTLDTIYLLEDYKEREIVRRFLLPNSQDPEVKAFKLACKRDEIPEELMVISNWEISTDRVMGGGDQALALQETSALLQNSYRYDPTAQRKILRDFTAVVKRDYTAAQLLVPDSPQTATDGRKAADTRFGTLMQGAQIEPPEGIEREDYIVALLQMAYAKIQTIQQTDNMGSPEELMGLENVLNHVGQNIQLLEADKNKKELVKQFSDIMGQLQNELKGFAQRLSQHLQEGQQGQDPEAQAKAQSMVMLASTKAKINQANAQQKALQRQQQFEQKMAQDMQKHQLEIQKAILELRTQIASDTAKTVADVKRQDFVAANQPEKNGD